MASALSARVAIPSFSVAKKPVQLTSTTSSRRSVAVCCEISESSASVSSQVAEEKWSASSSRRDVVGGAVALISGLFAAPAFALLEADDDDSLLEKVKEDRQKRIQKRGAIVSYKKEAESIQKAVYELSKAGQALDSKDFSAATAVLGSNLDNAWIVELKAALSTVSKSAEEQVEADTFSSALASLQSAVSKQDSDASKSAFVASASALEKWSSLTGFADQIKGL